MSAPHTEAEARARTARIHKLNDLLRDTFITGKVFLTDGIRALPEGIREDIITQVRCYPENAFTPDNDPYGEHDFGEVIVGGHKVFWKIDYYDQTLQWGSEDPADPGKTCRALTIMLASEY